VTSANAAASMMAPPLTATIPPAEIASRAKRPRPSIGLVRFSTSGLSQLLMTPVRACPAAPQPRERDRGLTAAGGPSAPDSTYEYISEVVPDCPG
jgi:hypothetical protein